MSKPPDWFETQQDIWRTWRAALGHNQPSTPQFENLWRALGINPEKLGLDTSAPWLSDAFQQIQQLLNAAQPATQANFAELFRAPLTTSLFGLGNFTNPFGFGQSDSGAPPDFTTFQSVPPLGLFREWQSAWREVTEAQLEQNKASQALSRQLAPVFETAIKRFVKSLNTQNDGLEDIKSLRALYDLWVGIAEQAYAEKVMTTQYSQAFGNFVNASARYRLAVQTLTSDIAEATNMPSRRELDALITRQHELEADIQILKQTAANGRDTESIEQALAQLSERVAALTSEPRSEETLKRTAPRKPRETKSPSTQTPRKRRATGKIRTRKARAVKSEFDIASFDSSNPVVKT